jgi:hypothetical protein
VARPSHQLITATAVILMLAGCGGGSSNSGTGPNPNPNPTPPAAMSLAISPVSTSLPQGGSVQVVASAARTNFSAAVTLTVTGAPTGVTSTISQPQGSGAIVTGTVIFVAAASTAPGTYSLTIQAAATGVTSVSATFALTITAVGTYTITGAASGTTVAPGGTGLVLLGIVRNNFAAPITFVADSLPAGVTGTFTPNPVVFNAATLTLTVGASVSLGTYRLSIRGTAAGFPDRSVPLTLTVAALGSFTLSASPSPASVAQGTSRAVVISITRIGGFSGIVLLTVEGVPAGLSIALNPPLVGTSSSTLTLTAAANLAAGNYTLTIRGQSAGVAQQSISLPVQVTASSGGTGNVTLDFSACVGFDVPAWVAWQDGNGAWARVTGTGNVYRFSVTAATGSFAYVIPGPTSQAQIQIQHMTRAEISAAPFVYCSGTGPALKVVNGSVTGVTGGDGVNISLGGGFGFANPQITVFNVAGVQNGAHDLIAWRHDFIGDITGAGNPDRGFVRRDQNIASGGSVGVLDMNGPESFGPSSAVFTVSGMGTGDEVSHTMRYNTGASCVGSMLYSSVRMSGNTFIGYGFPASLQRSTDYHQVSFTSTTRQGGILFPVAQRTLIETFQTMGSRTLTLGAALALPTITTLPATYKRLQAMFTLAAEYNSGATLTYSVPSQRKAVTIFATPAWIGGSNVTLAMPNFTGLAGWNDTWPPASGSTGQWLTTVSGTTLIGPSFCVNNTRTVSAMRQGSF